jgi:hypothetical protein
VVVEGIELPLQDMIRRDDVQGVADNLRSAMRRGPQLNHLWAERYRLVVSIRGPVIESYLDADPPITA